MNVIDIRNPVRSTVVSKPSIVTDADLLFESVTVYVVPMVSPVIVANPAELAVADFDLEPSEAVTVAFAVV